MATSSSLPGSRLTRAVHRGLAALSLLLSIAAPLHGLLHEQHEPGAGRAVQDASHEARHAAEGCPLCTLAGSPALQVQLPALGVAAPPARPASPRAVVLASREGAAASARGPPAPTC